MIVPWRSLLLGAFAFASLVVLAFGQDWPQGMTMHRIQAGEPDASGWMLAASTEGGFSVRLPLKFDDFTFVESDPKSPTLRVFTVGAASHEGIRFSATRVVYRKGAASANDFFARFENGQGLGARPERITSHKFRDRRAVDAVLETASSVGFERVVLLDSDLLLMVVESPRSDEATAQKFAAAFFDSLVVGAR
jgi:hypothetical protein